MSYRIYLQFINYSMSNLKTKNWILSPKKCYLQRQFLGLRCKHELQHLASMKKTSYLKWRVTLTGDKHVLLAEDMINRLAKRKWPCLQSLSAKRGIMTSCQSWNPCEIKTKDVKNQVIWQQSLKCLTSVVSSGVHLVT